MSDTPRAIMEELADLVRGKERSPARAQAILRTLLIDLEDVLRNPGKEQGRRLRRDELTGAGVRLLLSCGFTEAGPHELLLLPKADLGRLRDAQEALQKLLAEAERQEQEGTSPPAKASTTVEIARSAAAALKLAAASVSPHAAAAVSAGTLGSTPGPGYDSTLRAARGPPPKPRGQPQQGPKNTSMVVPQSVLQAAAAVSQAAAAGGVQGQGALLGLGPGQGVAGTINAGRGAGAAPGAALAGTATSPGRSRGKPRLPAAEFSYIGRPAETFEGRWTAIEEALLATYGDNWFTLIDVGSNHGYFSVNTSLQFPNAEVVGVEGSVGVGNGVVGVSSRSVARIGATSAIKTHLSWIEKLRLTNCFVAPEVWDLDHIIRLRESGLRADVMLSLSVVHHIDGICQDSFAQRGLGKVHGSLVLIAELLKLANVHVLELPDKPWLEHLHNKFGTPRAIIEAAADLTGEAWTMRQIHRNDWYGTRELWLIESLRGADTVQSLRPFFEVLLPGDDRATSAEAPAQVLPRAAAAEPRGGAPKPVRRVGAQPTAEDLGAALLAAPTTLIAAHVQLREAVAAAETALQGIVASESPELVQ